MNPTPLRTVPLETMAGPCPELALAGPAAGAGFSQQPPQDPLSVVYNCTQLSDLDQRIAAAPVGIGLGVLTVLRVSGLQVCSHSVSDSLQVPYQSWSLPAREGRTCSARLGHLPRQTAKSQVPSVCKTTAVVSSFVQRT